MCVDSNYTSAEDSATLVHSYISVSLIIILGIIPRTKKVKRFFGKVKGAVKEFVDDHGDEIIGMYVCNVMHLHIASLTCLFLNKDSINYGNTYTKQNIMCIMYTKTYILPLSPHYIAINNTLLYVIMPIL